jgi:oligoribonuclease
MRSKADKLIWIDLEMTGLNTLTDHILEIAAIITDRGQTGQFKTIAESDNLIVYQPPEVLEAVEGWSKHHHSASGLLESVKHSQITLEDAQDKILAFIKQHVDLKASPMCGNSICQDRRFLFRCMPKLEEHFHFRNLDVSTLRELVHYMNPKMTPFIKEYKHRALDDVRESINELNHYIRYVRGQHDIV